MSTLTVTTEQVRELIEQLAAMTAAASITPQMVANIFENMRQLNDQEREKVIATAEACIAEIRNLGISAENVSGADLEVADENGFAIVRFENGHIKTQKFDSAETLAKIDRKVDKDGNKGLSSNDYTTAEKNKLASIKPGAEPNDASTTDSSVGDLVITDPNDNALVLFFDGHLRTKNFNSKGVTDKLATIEEGAEVNNTNTNSEQNFDFGVSDNNGNYVLAVKNGYPITKNFNGKEVKDSLRDNASRINSMQGDITSLNGRLPNISSIYGWEAVDLNNPLSKIRFDAGLTPTIQHWGFIGDSLSSGCHGYDTGVGTATGTDIYEYSWGQFICRLCGSEGKNFSYGGASAKTWLANQNYGWAIAQLSENHKQAYTIALGINDSSSLNSLYSDGVGDADVDLVVDANNPYDYSHNNENTFIGCYGGIIQRLRSVNPRCRIFVLTMLDKNFSLQTHLAMDAEIRKLPAKFENVYLIDLATYAPQYYSSPLHDNLVYWSHLTSDGYVWLAYLINTYIDWIIRTNLYAFRDIAFVGTDKYMNQNL